MDSLERTKWICKHYFSAKDSLLKVYIHLCIPFTLLLNILFPFDLFIMEVIRGSLIYKLQHS